MSVDVIRGQGWDTLHPVSAGSRPDGTGEAAGLREPNTLFAYLERRGEPRGLSLMGWRGDLGRHICRMLPRRPYWIPFYGADAGEPVQGPWEWRR